MQQIKIKEIDEIEKEIESDIISQRLNDIVNKEKEVDENEWITTNQVFTGNIKPAKDSKKAEWFYIL